MSIKSLIGVNNNFNKELNIIKQTFTSRNYNQNLIDSMLKRKQNKLKQNNNYISQLN